MSLKKEIQTILVILAGLLVFYYFFLWKILLVLICLISLLSLASPFMRAQIVRAWYRLAEGLGYVNSRLLLGFVFFLILTPLAWLSRLFSKDKLQLKKKDSAESSYYKKREYTFTAEDFENPW